MAQKILPVLIFALCVLISHLALPLANNHRDFLFFSPWNMFSEPVRQFNYDIAFDGGASFLFRDSRHLVKNTEINLVTLYSLLWGENVARIKADFGRDLRKLCQCEKVELIQIKGSIHDHVVRKAAPEIMARWPL